jgi:hypothetical protein
VVAEIGSTDTALRDLAPIPIWSSHNLATHFSTGDEVLKLTGGALIHINVATGLVSLGCIVTVQSNPHSVYSDCVPVGD